MDEYDAHDLKLQQIAAKLDQLNGIKDVDILLENILSAAREISHADAGSIYEYVASENLLKIRYSQNDSQQKKLAAGEKLPYISFSFRPTPETISGYCFLSKKIINIADCYNMSEYEDLAQTKKRPYKFGFDADKRTGYHTTSMLAIPLFMTDGRVLGVLQIINAQDDYGNVIPFSPNVEFYIQQFAARIGQTYENAFRTRQWIERIVKTAGLRDPRETGAHVERVASFAVEIYDRYASDKGIDTHERNKFRDRLKLAAKCHDVGKVGVPDKILKKQGCLKEDERAIMKGHTCIGAQIFTPAEDEWDEMARDVCLHHHDRWDGGDTGYPGNFNYMMYEPETLMPTKMEQALKGADIPLAARIVAIADVYDALRHRRVYKEPWTLDATVTELKNQAGRQFDPELITAFMEILDRLEAINNSIE
ncbi:MAG: HD domain-containing protein [Treponema sp.]|nr:HD domain-containing protein [Treponema sp.]